MLTSTNVNKSLLEPNIMHSAFDGTVIPMEEIDRDIRPLVHVWNRLPFTRTMFGCAGHYGRRHREYPPYLYFVVDPRAGQTPRFVYGIAQYAETSGMAEVGLRMMMFSSTAYSFDHESHMGYAIHTWYEKITRTHIHRLRTRFWPGLTRLVAGFVA